MTILLMIIFFSTVSFTEIQAEQRDPLAYGEETYQWYCAACHGNEGDGKGFNAKNLDPRPADHTDKKLMNKRTNDELYNVIEGGGRAAGKSTLMPPWGNTFSEAQMEALVLYLRKLCGCKM